MKIFSLFLFILFYLFSLSVQAFEVGSGSEFSMETEGQTVELSIYITGKKENKLDVEFHFGAGGFLPINMYQQFEMEVSPSSGIVIHKGYVLMDNSKFPERLERENFYINEGVQLQDFLFSDGKELAKDFVGNEKVELVAGTVEAKHYRKSHAGQIVDFWISDKVKPIGLVKLISKSKKIKKNNYSIYLKSLLKNVKATINPKKAQPLTLSTRKLLSRKK